MRHSYWNHRASQLARQAALDVGKRSIAASLGQIALIAVYAVFTDFRRDRPVLLTWSGGAILAACFLRLYLAVDRAAYIQERRRLWQRFFALSLIASTVGWSVLFYSAITHYGLFSRTTTISLLVGSGISAAFTLSVTPMRRLAGLLITLLLGVPLVRVLMLSGPDSTAMALIFVVYYVFLMDQLRIQNRIYWDGLRDRLQVIEERDKLRIILDAIPGLVAWLGPDLGYHGVNRNYAAYFGGLPIDFGGRALSDDREGAEFVNTVRQFFDSVQDEQTVEIYLPQGKECRCHLLVMRKMQSEAYLIGIDINDLKTAQAALNDQRSKAEAASRLAALGEITANIAHEIRNPLSAAIGSLQLLRQGKGSAPELVERALVASRRIERIVSSLMRFSRKVENEPFVVVDLRNVISESLDLIAPHFRSNQVALAVDPIAPGLKIRCRPLEVSQVLINLLTNALDAARAQKEKWVRLSVVGVEDEWVKVAVTDSGEGISPHVSEKLFQAFFTTKPAGTGTGLGLSISKRIIDEHGGRIEVDYSAPHTTFVVSLRRAVATEQPQQLEKVG